MPGRDYLGEFEHIIVLALLRLEDRAYGHAARVGSVTDTGRMLVRHHGVPVADIPASALTDGAPVYQREARRPAYLDETSRWTPERAGLADLDLAGARAALPRLLSHPTIA